MKRRVGVIPDTISHRQVLPLGNFHRIRGSFGRLTGIGLNLRMIIVDNLGWN